VSRRVAAVALLLAGTTLAAAAAADYGYRFALELDGSAAAYRLRLTPAVYARISDRGLGDLEAFNAAGEALPFGPVPRPASAAAGRRVAVPWFELPAASSAAADDDGLRLRIVREPDGRLRRLDADVGGRGATGGPQQLLLDLGALDARADALHVGWRRDGDVSAQFSVSASDDLLHWRPLRADARLIDLQHDERRLLRERIELPPTRQPYLLLRRIDAGAALAFTTIEATLPGQPDAAAPAWLELEAEPDPARPGGWHYRLPGPLAVSAIDLQLAGANAVATVAVDSRDGDGPWQPRARFTAFRLAEGEGSLGNDPVGIGPTRDRQWRLQSEPPLAPAPRLRVGYHADEFALLPRGDGPFHLAAGSARARRPDYPLARLLEDLRVRRGSELPLAAARIGAEQVLSGEGALRAALPWRQWALWSALVAGALLVIGMVLRISRGG
jgi:hypothetical protein